MPVVDESLPPDVVHVTVARPLPTTVARKATRSPSVTVLGEATMLHVTVGQGGSVTSNEAVQVDTPVVTQSAG
jgi:hypothetical protein